MFGVSISKKEWLYVAAWAIVMVAFSLLPHIVGYASAPEGKQYMMTGYPIYQDANTYFTWIRQAAEGNILFQIKYTHEPHVQAFFHPLFLVMGLLVRAGVPLEIVWYGTQALAVITLVFMLYVFYSRYFVAVRKRLFALVLSCVAGGFGFLMFAFRIWPAFKWRPVDVELPEATIGYSMMWPAVFAFSIALMLAIFLLLISYQHDRRWRLLVTAGFLSLILALIHPYDSVIVAFVAALYLFITLGRKAFLPLVVVGAFIAVPAAYHVWLLQDPVFAEHATFSMLSPSPIAYVVGFGFVLMLAILGIIEAMRTGHVRRASDWLLPIAWAVVLPVMLYFPISFQRRLVEGAIVTLVLFTVVGLERIWSIVKIALGGSTRLTAVFRWGLMTLSIVIMGLTTVTHVLYDVRNVQSGSFPFYFTDGMVEAMEWLEDNTAREDVVLSTWGTGNFIPRVSGNTVFLGHGAQTVHAVDKHFLAEDFFSGRMTFDEQDALLSDNNISYIFVGPFERKGGLITLKANVVFENSDVSIYRVQR